MKLFVNNHHDIQKLTDAQGKVVQVRPNQKILLPDYFDKYVTSGHLVHARAPTSGTRSAASHTKNRQSNSLLERRNKKTETNIINPENNPSILTTKNNRQNMQRAEIQRPQVRSQRQNAVRQKKLPTAPRHVDGQNKFKGKSIPNPRDQHIYDQSDNLSGIINISNDIGVGILSYNRQHSLKRLVDSIIKNTNLSKTTIFISDDGSTEPETISYLSKLAATNRFCIIMNEKNLGIAGNSNRLLQCLQRFKYGIILNDDVEITSSGWEYFYPDAMQITQFKHFIYREKNIYGATIGDPYNVKGINLLKSDNQPQGAVLAYETSAVEKIGFFNEAYGQYGMEHVDWSTKFNDFGLHNVNGFFDVYGSSRYFLLHNEKSSVPERSEKLQFARNLFRNRVIKKYNHSEDSKTDSISVVIPYRSQDRSASVITVIDSIKGQLFPTINIILSEHDHKATISATAILPSICLHIHAESEEPFNKSKAFNGGVDIAKDDYLILHDADMLVPNYYVSEVYKTLLFNSSCHLGKDVSYYDNNDTDIINREKRVFRPQNFERYVSYFEGGSLACTKKYYSEIGGFYEAYSGYGCEDCDFYARLIAGGNFKDDRRISLYHLNHPRSDKWQKFHDQNVKLETTLKTLSNIARIADAKNLLIRKGYKTI
jgi:GT2 family glycosyltransferase